MTTSPSSKQAFKAASTWLSSTPAAASLPNNVKLELYGLFKYITTQQGPTGSRPSIFYQTLRAKYDAHLNQSQLYASNQDGLNKARIRYIDIAKDVGWAGEGCRDDEDEEGEVDVGDIDLDAVDVPGEKKGKERREGMGVKVSMMSAARDDDEDIESRDGIHDAVIDDVPERVLGILKTDPGTLNAKDEYGNTPLHLAVDRGFVEITRILIKAGADRRALDEDDQTPLQIARLLDRKEIIAILEAV